MSEYISINPDNRFENPKHSFDSSYQSPQWGILQFIGVDNQGSPVLTGQEYYDIKVILKPKSYKPEIFLLKTDISPEFPVEDQVWCRQLLESLGRQGSRWAEHEYLFDILNAINPKVLPGIGNKWTKEAETGWMEELLSTIASNYYDKLVWDPEEHNQDSPVYFEEWKNNTNELRH